MADADAQIRQHLLQALRHGVDRLHAVMEIKYLSAALDFTRNGVLDQFRRVLAHDGLDRKAVHGRRLNDRERTSAHEREVERARDRRRAHGENVDGEAHLFDALLVPHAEAVLLVDHKQSQILELYVLPEEPVRADDDVHPPVFELRDDLVLLLRRAEAAEHFDRDGELGEALAKGVEMLLRQHRRRR